MTKGGSMHSNTKSHVSTGLFWETISLLVCTNPYADIGPDLVWQKCSREEKKAHKPLSGKFFLQQVVFTQK